MPLLISGYRLSIFSMVLKSPKSVPTSKENRSRRSTGSSKSHDSASKPRRSTAQRHSVAKKQSEQKPTPKKKKLWEWVPVAVPRRRRTRRRRREARSKATSAGLYYNGKHRRTNPYIYIYIRECFPSLVLLLPRTRLRCRVFTTPAIYRPNSFFPTIPN